MRRAFWLALVIIGSACGQQPGAPAVPPPPPPLPTVPDAGTLDIDLEFFRQSLEPEDTPGDNWWYTSGRVSETSDKKDAILIIAESILTAASRNTPLLVGTTWHWRFTVSFNTSPYVTDLAGRIEGEESVWEARVTAPNHGIVNGRWFDGRARLDGTTGTWRIHHLQVDSTKVLADLTWSHPSANRWEITLLDHNLTVDTMHVAYIGEGDHRTMTAIKFLAPQADTVRYDVEWDRTMRRGSLLAPVFNGGTRACWGEHLENLVCP